MEGKEMPLIREYDMAGERIRFESAGEYSLPEYLPEVRRVLLHRCRAMPLGSYPAGGRVEYSGEAAHTVLYLSGEGTLASLSFRTPYSFSHASAEGACVFAPPPMAESLGHRLFGPRRLSVRAVFTCTPHVYAPAGESELPPLEEQELVALRASRSASHVSVSSRAGIPFRDSFHDEGEHLTLLSSEGTVLVHEVREEGEMLRVSGELALSLLLTGGELPYTVERTIPFEETLPIEGGYGQTVGCLGWGELSMLDVLFQEEEEGTEVTVDAAVTLTASRTGSYSFDEIIDLFSKKSPLEVSKNSIPYTEMMMEMPYLLNFSCKGEAGESAQDAAIAPGGVLTGITLSPQAEGNVLTVHADCRADLLLIKGSDADGNPEPLTVPASFSFEEKIALPGELPEGMLPEIVLTDSTLQVRLEGGCPVFTGCLPLLLRACRTGRSESVTGFALREEAGESGVARDEVRAVYPEDRDSLWSIAKRYRVSPEHLARLNGIPEGKLASPALPSSIDGLVRILVTSE